VVKRWYWRAFLGLWAALLLTPAAGAQLYDLNGKPQDLRQFVGEGKWTLVMFWASNCPVCNAEAADYVTFHDRHYEKDAIVVGVSLDGMERREEALAFIERHLADFPNLIGEPEAVAGLFTRLTGGRQPWLGTPSFLLYSPRGELIGWHIGPVSVEAVEDQIQQGTKASSG